MKDFVDYFGISKYVLNTPWKSLSNGMQGSEMSPTAVGAYQILETSR